MLRKLKQGETIPLQWYNDLVDVVNKLEEKNQQDLAYASKGIETLNNGVKTSTVVKKVNELICLLKEQKLIK